MPIVAKTVRNRAGAKGAQEGGDVNDQTTGNKSKKVSDWWTKQFEEAQAEIERYLHWSWVEPAVWTTRMLTALEKGIKGGKWFSLIDKVYAHPNLLAAFAKVKANKGAAGVDQGRRGHGLGRDHQRWPNAYFEAHGLFSLASALAQACQSSRR